jgi:hypothetical protein
MLFNHALPEKDVQSGAPELLDTLALHRRQCAADLVELIAKLPDFLSKDERVPFVSGVEILYLYGDGFLSAAIGVVSLLDEVEQHAVREALHIQAGDQGKLINQGLCFGIVDFTELLV